MQKKLAQCVCSTNKNSGTHWFNRSFEEFCGDVIEFHNSDEKTKRKVGKVALIFVVCSYFLRFSAEGIKFKSGASLCFVFLVG